MPKTNETAAVETTAITTTVTAVTSTAVETANGIDWSEFKKEIRFIPAYDKKAEGYGVHGVEMLWMLSGPKGVVQFLVYTNWHLPRVWSSIIQNAARRLQQGRTSPDVALCTLTPMPADLGYHTTVRQYPGQTHISESCPYLDGKPCYYGGSSLNANKVFQTLIEKGHDAVWEHMKEVHDGLGTVDAPREYEDE